MKYLFLIISFYSTTLKSQTILNFDKRFVECEDKWVAFQMNEDSTFSFGFIYIDAQAGLTLNFEGTFEITKDSIFIPKKLDSTNIKYRLQPNQVKVAIIPNTKFKELEITAYPDWLKFYKTDTVSIQRLYRWGFLYNSWNECSKALTYLEKAQELDPKYKGLEFELAFAYNALEMYDKSIAILESAIKTSPKDCYLYKELSFAQMHLGQLDKASESCKKGIAACSDKSLKSEIAYNLAYEYYKLKDKEKFRFWSDETKKWSTKGDQFRNNISKMETDLAK